MMMQTSTRRFYWLMIFPILVLTIYLIRINSFMSVYEEKLRHSIAKLQIYVGLTDAPFIPNHPNETNAKKPPNIPRTFLIEEEDFCAKRPDLDYIVYVHSALSNVQARNDTRMTWANQDTAEKLGLKMGVVYVVGRPKNEEERLILMKESELYHDIIQGDFADEYKLLVYKALAALEWITRHCNNVPWTIHTDDDVLVDIVLMDKALKERGVEAKDEFLCLIIAGVPVMRDGTWAVDFKDLSEDWYPPYCDGPFWALQTRNMKPLLNASQYVNYLWVDDVYLTGFLPREMGSIGHTWLPNYNYYQEQLNVSHVGNTVFWLHERGAQRNNWKHVLEYYQNTLKIPGLNGT